MTFREVLSPGEERFERRRKALGYFLAPLVFIVLYFAPLGTLADRPQKLAAVLGLVIVFWLTETIPLAVAAILGAVLNVLLGVAPAREVFAPFAHPLVFLFIGSFILAEAITQHGLDRRFAFTIFSIRFLQKSPARVLFAFGLIVAVVSMWISNTASTAMMLPIALGVLAAMKDLHGDSGGYDFNKFSTAMMLMVAYGASVGGIATPIGTPPNVIGLGMINELIGVRITFYEWMVFALPITAVMFIFLFITLGSGRAFKRARLIGIDAFMEKARNDLGPWKRGEINTAFCFAVAVFLWILPSIAGLALGKEAELAKLLTERLNTGVVAVFAATLLFLMPVSFKKAEFTMGWRRASRIDWGTILLFGGGLSLGSLMFSTGLADFMGKALTGATGASSLWGITAIGTALAIILSETTSNTASANMIIPVMIAIAQGAGVSALPPALGATLGASFGFMLPVSTPPNAIVYGSGLVPILSMVRKGVIFDIGGFFIIVFGVMGLTTLLGWA
ncbi:MAG: DASS family sodium-coupled anion symporter [Thermodesulfobacteriota bacterium]|nr:MAG: DASS family sodium-coupled anion symporter [Thermodesulfobacteriota bacterium]